MNKIRVLVTGADGQLAKTIHELYANNAFNIDFVFFNKDMLDITNADNITVEFSKKKYHYCINCAAYTNVEQAEKTPEKAYQVNAKGVMNLAHLCKEYGATLIHISTDYVFDGEKKNPYTIIDKPNPINEYGKSKYQGELYIQDTIVQHFIIRTSWLYSKKYGHNFYRTIVKKAKLVDQLRVTKEQIGCPTNTVNLAEFIFKIIRFKNKSFGILHFCDKQSMTWYDFAKNIVAENNLSCKVEANNFIVLAKRPKNSRLAN